MGLFITLLKQRITGFETKRYRRGKLYKFISWSLLRRRCIRRCIRRLVYTKVKIICIEKSLSDYNTFDRWAKLFILSAVWSVNKTAITSWTTIGDVTACHPCSTRQSIKSIQTLYLSLCLSACLFLCVLVSLSISVCFFLFVCLSFFRMFVCLSVCASVLLTRGQRRSTVHALGAAPSARGATPCLPHSHSDPIRRLSLQSASLVVMAPFVTNGNADRFISSAMRRRDKTFIYFISCRLTGSYASGQRGSEGRRGSGLERGWRPWFPAECCYSALAAWQSFSSSAQNATHSDATSPAINQ